MPPNIPANAPQPKTIMQEFEAGAEIYLYNPNLTQAGMVGLISPVEKSSQQDHPQRRMSSLVMSTTVANTRYQMPFQSYGILSD